VPPQTPKRPLLRQDRILGREREEENKVGSSGIGAIAEAKKRVNSSRGRCGEMMKVIDRRRPSKLLEISKEQGDFI